MLRFEIAAAKAFGALAVGVGSRKLSEMVQERPQLLSGLSTLSGGRILALPGGVLMRSGGEIIAAVGVTGDTSDNDELCAVHGIRALGLAFEA